MLELLHDGDERERLVDAGHQRASAFSWTTTARDTLAAYRDAVVGDDTGDDTGEIEEVASWSECPRGRESDARWGPSGPPPEAAGAENAAPQPERPAAKQQEREAMRVFVICPHYTPDTAPTARS